MVVLFNGIKQPFDLMAKKCFTINPEFYYRLFFIKDKFYPDHFTGMAIVVRYSVNCVEKNVLVRKFWPGKIILLGYIFGSVS